MWRIPTLVRPGWLPSAVAVHVRAYDPALKVARCDLSAIALLAQPLAVVIQQRKTVIAVYRRRRATNKGLGSVALPVRLPRTTAPGLVKPLVGYTVHQCGASLVST